LFPSAPERPGKRHDRAAEIAQLAGAELLGVGAIVPEDMPHWVNAASAVLVTSENEGFGLAAVEALACDVPVLSTPVGVAPALLRGVEGCLAGPFDASRWAEVVNEHLDAPDPRVSGRDRARWFSAEAMAERALVAYREVLGIASSASP
jgi:glycosyltransferase involved in cell wall biosynthesis